MLPSAVPGGGGKGGGSGEHQNNPPPGSPNIPGEYSLRDPPSQLLDWDKLQFPSNGLNILNTLFSTDEISFQAQVSSGQYI